MTKLTRNDKIEIVTLMQNINFDELFVKFRYPLLILLVGLILTACGVFFVKSNIFSSSTKVEVLEGTTVSQGAGEITVEIAGEIMKPGVYKLPNGSRVEDLLISADGLSVDADRVWTDKYLNRAAKLSDGQKVFIPSVNQQSEVLSAKTVGGDQTISSTFSSDSTSFVNINSADLKSLDSLPGIGPVYAQNIIEHRPYSTVEELLSKEVLKTSVYNKIKEMVSVY